MIRIFFLSLLLVCGLNAATTYYVTQAGAGSANGSTLGNAWSAANFNTSGNWSATAGTAGKISPDDTVSLNGTFTPGFLATQGAGLSGHKITILFASGAKISGSGWTGNGITVNHAFITIDGGTNGLIENLSNGTGLTFQANCNGVSINSVTDCTVQNLTCSPLYIRTAGSEANDYGDGVNAGGSGNCNNLVVDHCTFNNLFAGTLYSFRTGATNVTYSNNSSQNQNWGFMIGDNGTSGNSISGIRVFGNTCTNWAGWENTSNLFHHNGVFIFCNNTGGGITDVQVYNNSFGPGFAAQNTSAIYINGTINSTPYIFNNLFLPAINEGVSNGMITLRAMNNNVTCDVFNNTFVQLGTTGGGGTWMQIDVGGVAMTVNHQNNVFTGPWFYNVVYLPGSGTIPYTGNHNIFYLAPNFGDAGGQETLTVWKSLGAGFDNDAVTTDPKLNASTYIPASGSSAIGAGVNLTSLGITALNSDRAGNARPGSGAWDAGALNYISGVTPAVPTNYRKPRTLAGGF